MATGGVSYSGTGSTGEGHEMARKLGHTVTNLKPSLVPLNTKEEWVRELQGLSLKMLQSIFLIKEEKEFMMISEK